jgi:N-methylhydantoinase A/oxoprolinase/acetone carboxylase beta subunit
MSLQSPAQVMGIDAGGTMTDTFFVRKDGRCVVGKAQSKTRSRIGTAMSMTSSPSC